MRKAIVFLLVAALSISVLSTPAIAASKKPAKTPAAKKVTKIVKKKTPAKPAKKVLGAKTTYVPTLFSIIACNMPDGKIIKVPKKDCDAVTAFWNSIKPNNPPAPSSNNGGGSSSNNSNNNSSNNSNSNSQSNHVPATYVSGAVLLPCGSSSCGNISTIKVTGANFLPNTKIELLRNGITYSENTSVNNAPDAMLTGGNGTTEVIMDFYNLPSGFYEVKVVAPSKTILAPNTISI